MTLRLFTRASTRLLLGASAQSLAFPALARAESCTYNAATASVSASITPRDASVLDVVGGAIRFGAVPTPCGRRRTNTDSIFIAGAVGTTERLTLDQRTGLLAPGATLEFNIPEIEIATSLGDATDTIILYLTEGDVVAQGQNGLAMNSDGDLDVTVSPGAFPMKSYATRRSRPRECPWLQWGRPSLPRPGCDRRRGGGRHTPRQLRARRFDQGRWQ